MRKLKMWTGNYDGLRRGLVITTSKEKARKIVNASRADFDAHWHEELVDCAIAEYEVLYTRPIDHARTPPPWTQGRCPLPKEKTR